MSDNLPQRFYPAELDADLRRLLPKQRTREKVYELFDQGLEKIYITGNRWFDVPCQTLEGILGKRYYKILPLIANYFQANGSWSNWNHQSQSYCFTDLFIKTMLPSCTWESFLDFVKGVDASLKKRRRAVENEALGPGSTPPIMFPRSDLGSKSIYRVDYEKLTKVSEFLYNAAKFGRKIDLIANVKTTQRNLENILSGEVKETVSDKTGRHYTSITQLPRLIRECLIKNGGGYFGQLDLKCCHGFEVLAAIKHLLTFEEYQRMFDELADPNLWTHLMERTGIECKDKVKEKFQLFLNGSYRQNKGNPIYNLFQAHHTGFTQQLFLLKRDKSLNLSNAMSQIEASVMHSPELNAWIRENKIHCDIIHDCLWFYGKVDEDLIVRTAQFILRLFRDKEGVEMVFTLEVTNKPKQVIKDEQFWGWVKKTNQERFQRHFDKRGAPLFKKIQKRWATFCRTFFRDKNSTKDWSSFHVAKEEYINGLEACRQLARRFV